MGNVINQYNSYADVSMLSIKNNINNKHIYDIHIFWTCGYDYWHASYSYKWKVWYDFFPIS